MGSLALGGAGEGAARGQGDLGDRVPEMDEDTKETLRMIRQQLDLGQEVEEEINWEDFKPGGADLDTIRDKLYLYTMSLKDKLYKKFKKFASLIRAGQVGWSREALRTNKQKRKDRACATYCYFLSSRLVENDRMRSLATRPKF